MTVQRTFYVTQGSLCIWIREGGVLSRLATFPDDDEGLREFDAYLGELPEQASALLVDVIEEEFGMDTIPRLAARDRKALIERRSARKFRNTPYRIADYQGRANKGDDEFTVLLSAISNQELLDPWLQIILKHKTPLCGVFSVPLMAPDIFGKLVDRTAPTLLVASHQGNRLRQVYLKDGRLCSARLSRSPRVGEDAYAQFIVTEAERSRRYLERVRLLGIMESLNVCVVAEPETAARIVELGAAQSSTTFTCIEPETVARKTCQAPFADIGHIETIYLAALFDRRPKHSYATSGETAYWNLRRLRHAIIGGAAAIAAVCSVCAAVLFSDTWLLSKQVDDIQSQLAQLSETFRRENEKFDPIKADSQEMKLAVDTGEFILENRLPIPWVMNQVGAVLGEYPEIQVRKLEWLAESRVAEGQAPRRSGNRPMPQPITRIDEVGAVLTAEIAPFDGNMRGAFARIDELAADLQDRTDFSRVITIEYPFNASPSAAVSGEIADSGAADIARFRIRVSYDVPASHSGEVNNEPG